MAEYPAIPLWTDAYLGDTQHLTTIEHGAYLLLLIAMWRAGGNLPNDDKRLARITRLGPKQWLRVKDTIWEFFEVSSDSISQRRLTAELTFVRQRSQSASDSAKARWLKDKNSGHAVAMPEACESDAPTPTPTPNIDSPDGESPPGVPPRKKANPDGRKKGTRLDSNWRPDERDLRYASEKGYSAAEIDDLAGGFVQHFANGKGHTQTHISWSRTWQNWVKNSAGFNKPPGFLAGGRSGRVDPGGDPRRAGGLVGAAARILDRDASLSGVGPGAPWDDH